MPERRTKILWLVNIVLPAVAEDLGLGRTPFGGWLSLMTARLAAVPEFEVGVAMRAPVESLTRVERGGIVYYAIPQTKRDKFDVRQEDCEQILAEFVPDILHAEGSEMRYTTRFLRTWQGHALLSMQGVINGIAPYQLGRLPILSMLNPLKPRIMITTLALIINKRFRFMPRLSTEREAMSMVSHLMGRTIWDRAQAAAINPKASYHHCSRILRPEFYDNQWLGNDCEKHSIFIGNSASPLKGVHIAIEAAALLRRRYPDLRIYIAGEDPAQLPGYSLKRYVGYPVYLAHLIRKLELQDHIIYTGILDAAEMGDRMCQSNVYVMTSIIENSPNTLAEAMIMGVPSVASYVGGVPSMARDGEDALLYRADDPAMLALQIQRVFDDADLCAHLSSSAMTRARNTHDPQKNVADLVDAYREIQSGILS